MLDRLDKLIRAARRNLRQNLSPFIVSWSNDCRAAKFFCQAFYSFYFPVELIALDRQLQTSFGQRRKPHILIRSILQQFLEPGSIRRRLWFRRKEVYQRAPSEKTGKKYRCQDEKFALIFDYRGLFDCAINVDYIENSNRE